MTHLLPIPALLEEVGRAAKAVREREKTSAPAFSVFADFLSIDENQISDIVAWMLDPAKTHAQGMAYLSAFLTTAGISVHPDGSPVVRRESLTCLIENCRRRMDIVVDWPARSEFALAIETKRDSAEQPAQATDYIHHLSKLGRNDYRLIYLTKEGGLPPSVEKLSPAEKAAEKEKIIEMTYKQLARWVHECAEISQAHAIAHFLQTFKQFILSEIDMTTPNAPHEIKSAISRSPESIKAAYQIHQAWKETRADIGKVFTDSLDGRLAKNWKVERGVDCLNEDKKWGGINIYRKGWGPYRVRFETACSETWQHILIGVHNTEGAAPSSVSGSSISTMRAMEPSYNAKLRRDYWEAVAILAQDDNFWWTPDFLWKMQSQEPELIEDVAGRMEEIAEAVDKIICDAVKNR